MDRVDFERLRVIAIDIGIIHDGDDGIGVELSDHRLEFGLPLIGIGRPRRYRDHRYQADRQKSTLHLSLSGTTSKVTGASEPQSEAARLTCVRVHFLVGASLSFLKIT
jgi:hypothetical protein